MQEYVLHPAHPFPDHLDVLQYTLLYTPSGYALRHLFKVLIKLYNPIFNGDKPSLLYNNDLVKPPYASCESVTRHLVSPLILCHTTFVVEEFSTLTSHTLML